MSQFKVEFIRYGVTYKPAYVKSIRSAIKRAQSKGWYGDKGGGCWDSCPIKTHVYQSVDGTHELVAIVDRHKVTAVDINDRRSVRIAKEEIKRSQLEIQEAETLAEIINRIAQGEDNDSQ
jgi:hypothetical protein